MVKLKHLLTNKNRIEANRKTINDLMLSSMKNIDSINMLRYQITSVEPVILFHQQQESLPASKRKMALDFTNMRNLGDAYDYILEHKHEKIDAYQMYQLHAILAKDTDVSSGYRISMAKVLGQFAPSAEKIYYKLDQIQYHLTDTHYSVLTRAFDLHFDIIETQPFNDLNKRLARFLMNWFLIQHGYRPIVFNKKTDSVEYMNALHERINGNHRAYTEYMEKSMLRTQESIIKLLKTR